MNEKIEQEIEGMIWKLPLAEIEDVVLFENDACAPQSGCDTDHRRGLADAFPSAPRATLHEMGDRMNVASNQLQETIIAAWPRLTWYQRAALVLTVHRYAFQNAVEASLRRAFARS